MINMAKGFEPQPKIQYVAGSDAGTVLKHGMTWSVQWAARRVPYTAPFLCWQGKGNKPNCHLMICSRLGCCPEDQAKGRPNQVTRPCGCLSGAGGTN